MEDEQNINKSLVKIPRYCSIYDDDGYYHFREFNVMTEKYDDKPIAKFLSEVEAEAYVKELNADSEPQMLYLNIDSVLP